MAYEDRDAQIESLQDRVDALEQKAGSGENREPTRQEALTQDRVAQMIETAIGRLRITGSGVTGSPKSGWAINPATIHLTAECDPDNPGKLLITAQS